MSNILKNFVVTVATKQRNKCLKLKPFRRLNYSSLETGCVLNLQRMSYKSTEKLFKKWRSSKNQLCLWKKKRFSKVITVLKSAEISFNTSKSQFGLLILRVSHDPTKKHKYIKKPKQFYDITLFRALWL